MVAVALQRAQIIDESEFGAQGLEPVHAAGGQHHGRAGLAERAGELRAQPAGRAGDKGHAAGKIDAVCHLERYPKSSG